MDHLKMYFLLKEATFHWAQLSLCCRYFFLKNELLEDEFSFEVAFFQTLFSPCSFQGVYPFSIKNAESFDAHHSQFLYPEFPYEDTLANTPLFRKSIFHRKKIVVLGWGPLNNQPIYWGPKPPLLKGIAPRWVAISMWCQLMQSNGPRQIFLPTKTVVGCFPREKKIQAPNIYKGVGGKLLEDVLFF